MPKKLSPSATYLLDVIERLDQQDYDRIIGPGFRSLTPEDLIYLQDKVAQELARRQSENLGIFLDPVTRKYMDRATQKLDRKRATEKAQRGSSLELSDHLKISTGPVPKRVQYARGPANNAYCWG